MPKNTRLWLMFVGAMVLSLIVVTALLSLTTTDEEEGPEESNWVPVTGTLDVTLGEVTLTSGEQVRALAVGERVEVREGDQIAVSAEGEALLTFFTGQQSRLAPGTQATVAMLDQANGFSRVRLDVAVGQAFSSVQEALDEYSRFEVQTPTAAVTVRGTEFVVAVRPDQLSQIVATEGTVLVTAGEQSAEILCGYGVPVRVDGMGDVRVWGMAQLDVTSPLEGALDVPVLFTNQANGQTFYFRSGDLFAVPLGTHDLVINTPGPVRLSDLDFPEDTSPEAIAPLPVTFSAAAITLVDAQGDPVEVDDHLLVTLQQGDLTGHAVAAPGEPLLVGPGEWEVTVALESAPAQTQTLHVTMEAGASATATVPMSGFGGK